MSLKDKCDGVIWLSIYGFPIDIYVSNRMFISPRLAVIATQMLSSISYP